MTLLKKCQIIKINLYFLNSKKIYIIICNYSFDNNKIKKLIDYALKPPPLIKEVNIEKINSTQNYLEDKDEEKKIFLSSYKYPYISSEILSHDYPFLLDKFININNNNNNNVKFNTNTSCILNDISNTDLNFIVDEFMEDTFSKKEIVKDEIFEEFGSGDNNENTIEIFENDGSDLELIDYLFNISFTEELNGVQGGYLIKIIRSLMHSLYSPNKSIIFIKYMLFRKNGEILNNIIKKIKYFYFQEIIYEILIYNDEENNFSVNGGLDKKKASIIMSLINYLKLGVEGVKEVFCEYIINYKNEELLINENPFNKFCSEFVFNNEEIFDKFCVISSHILKEYKFENCMLNNSKSFILRVSSSKGILNNSMITLNVTDKDSIISKFNKVVKNIQLNIITSTITKINLLTFIFDFMSLTRGIELLNNLKSINYFSFIKNAFFNSKNDIIQSIIINKINLLLKDGSTSVSSNYKWFNELLINNGFINEALNIKNKAFSNYGLCSESLFIHVAIILDILIKNLSDFLSSNNLLKKVENYYNKECKNYIERMNKAIYEVNNSLNLSQILNKNYDNESELKVDEVSDTQGVNTSVKGIKSVFDLTETSFIKKHSMNLLTIKEILPNAQEEKDFITNDDEVEKKMIQSIEEKKKF